MRTTYTPGGEGGAVTSVDGETGDVDLSDDYDALGAAAAAEAASQPADSDLTAIAALSTTSFGRSLLEAADASELQTLAETVPGTDVQAYDGDLTDIAALTPSAGSGLVGDGTDWTAQAVGLRGDRFGPTGALVQTMPRAMHTTNSAVYTSGTLRLMAIYLPKGLTVSSISVLSGSVALDTGSNQWFALFDASRNKVAISADDTSTAWAASTVKTLNMTTPYVVPSSGLYYIGVCIVASTPPNACTSTILTGAVSLAPIVTGNSNTGLTNPASCPSTADAITPSNNTLFAYVS